MVKQCRKVNTNDLYIRHPDINYWGLISLINDLIKKENVVFRPFKRITQTRLKYIQCFREGRKFTGKEAELFVKLLEYDYIQPLKVSYRSPPFAKDGPGKWNPEAERRIRLFRLDEHGEMLDPFELPYNQYKAHLHGKVWEIVEEDDFIIINPYVLPPKSKYGDSADFMQDRKITRYIEKWCYRMFQSINSWTGSLQDYWKVYCPEDLQSHAIEVLWRAGDDIKDEAGAYHFGYIRRHLNRWFWKEFNRTEPKEEKLQQHSDYMEGVTESYSWDAQECGGQKLPKINNDDEYEENWKKFR